MIPSMFRSIGARLSVSIVIMLIGFALIAAASVFGFNRIEDANAIRNNLSNQEHILEKFEIAVLETVVLMEKVVLENDTAPIPNLLAVNEDILSSFARFQTNAEVFGLVNDVYLATEFEPVIFRLRNDFYRIAALSRKQRFDEASHVMHGVLKHRLKIVKTFVLTARELRRFDVADQLSRIALLKERITLSAYGIFAAVVLSGIITTVAISRTITRPLAMLTRSVESFDPNDPGSDINFSARALPDDEIGLLGRTFEKLSEELRSTISERKRSESDLKKLKEGLEQMVDERTTELREAQESLVRQERLAVLGQMSAVVSHELRNPLGTIRTSMITIADNTEGRGLDVEGAIERIVRNIKRCDGIIVELLDYTRDTAPNREPTDVDEWLGGVLDELEVPPGLSLGRDLASGVEADIDRDRLRRAVINIYDNACQAVTGNGNGADKEVAVATRADGERVEIEVTDSGPGIADDELGHIFEPLYSTKSFGIGLGLPVVKKIAEEHGGGVGISSEIGRGTRVTLWLPLTAPEQGGNETS